MSDPFLTTVVGSMPKPSWLQAKTAMNEKESDHHGYGASWELEDEILREAHDDAVRVAIHDQEKAGVDIISDGEQRRRSYLTYVTMQMGGIDYEALAEKWIRNGRRLARVGRCVEPVYRKGPMVVDDLRFLMG